MNLFVFLQAPLTLLQRESWCSRSWLHSHTARLQTKTKIIIKTPRYKHVKESLVRFFQHNYWRFLQLKRFDKDAAQILSLRILILISDWLQTLRWRCTTDLSDTCLGPIEQESLHHVTFPEFPSGAKKTIQSAVRSGDSGSVCGAFRCWTCDPSFIIETFRQELTRVSQEEQRVVCWSDGRWFDPWLCMSECARAG